MADFAGSALATAVTVTGGIGLIGTDIDMNAATQRLLEAKNLLTTSGHITPNQEDSVLPVGIGFLPFIASLSACVAVVKTSHPPPAIIWLFAAHDLPADHAAWTREMRAASPKSKIWIQTGSVAAALAIAASCAPDALVIQGTDAGGHGFERGAGIISLLPEVSDALAKQHPDRKIPLLAAGGIVDARGVAAAYALGASGVVMGTRFLASKEVMLPHPAYQAAILATRDGGQSTVRAKVFDELRGPNRWPGMYDGRGLMTESWRDWKEGGVGVEELRRRFGDASSKEGEGFGEAQGEGEGGWKVGRATVWAGTGVGLVNEVKGAAEIVEEVKGGFRGVVEERLKF